MSEACDARRNMGVGDLPGSAAARCFFPLVLWVDGRKGMPDPSRMSRPGIMILFAVGQWRARR
jgi:hypothetical protein